jgi:hypothetical protein
MVELEFFEVLCVYFLVPIYFLVCPANGFSLPYSTYSQKMKLLRTFVTSWGTNLLK